MRALLHPGVVSGTSIDPGADPVREGWNWASASCAAKAGTALRMFSLASDFFLAGGGPGGQGGPPGCGCRG